MVQSHGHLGNFFPEFLNVNTIKIIAQSRAFGDAGAFLIAEKNIAQIFILCYNIELQSDRPLVSNFTSFIF